MPKVPAAVRASDVDVCVVLGYTEYTCNVHTGADATIRCAHTIDRVISREGTHTSDVDVCVVLGYTEYI